MRARTILISVLILAIAALTFAAAATIAKRPSVQITKMTLAKNIVLAPGTGVQGTLTFPATLDTQLKTMTCSDIKVYVGKWVTPPPPSGSNMPGGPISVPQFQEVASTTATGSMPVCSYAIRNAPAAMPLDMVLDANQRFACNLTSLMTQPGYSSVKLTFTSGQMKTQNFQVTPHCEIVY